MSALVFQLIETAIIILLLFPKLLDKGTRWVRKYWPYVMTSIKNRRIQSKHGRHKGGGELIIMIMIDKDKENNWELWAVSS